MSTKTKSNLTMTNRNFKTFLSVGVGLAAVSTFLSPAVAQDATDDDGARTLQTVTITATKREQTLQDVPVAVSVVGEDAIEKAEIQDLGDLQSLVPSLVVGQLQSSANTNFIIRGFGNGANNVGIEPSVGVFIDGVYRSRSAAQISDLPNLQRVEVLRGPQSTLFGKNASAGVISIITQEAQFDWGGGLSATYGNFNTVRLAGDITGPLTDTLAFSLAANVNQRGGYADDLATGRESNERNRYGFRGQLQFEPSENVSFRLIADYDDIDEVCCVAGNVIDGPTGAVVRALGGNLDSENPFSYDVYGNFDSTNEITNSGVSLQGDFDMDFATLTSITAYRNVESYTDQDSDFTSADLIGKNAADSDIDTFTQELRLTSNNTDGAFDWMVGAFYFDESVEVEDDFQYGADFRGYADFLSGGGLAGVEAAIFGPAAVGTVFAQDGQGPAASYGQDNEAYSIFGTLDFHATDKLTATVGLNYTNDKKKAFYSQVNTDVFSGIDLVGLGVAGGLAGFGVDATDTAAVGAFAAANPAAFAAIQAGAADPATNPALGLRPLQFLPPFVDFPNAVEGGKTDDSELTYTLRLAYDINDNFNVYGSYATGFKSSSWNLSRDSRPNIADLPALTAGGLTVNNLTTGTRFAGPEESAVFELGLKAAFDRYAFNIAIFDQTIEGFQSNAFTGVGFALTNAEEQSVQGLEADINWAATDNFTITAAGTFLDPEYDSFADAYSIRDATGSTTGALGDLSGTTPSGIADTSLSIGGLYETTLSNGWNAFVRADWQYASDSEYADDPFDVANLEVANLDRGVDVINASIGVTTESGIAVNLWARNLLDDQMITTAFRSVAQDGSYSGYPSAPRTYGVTVRKEF